MATTKDDEKRIVLPYNHITYTYTRSTTIQSFIYVMYGEFYAQRNTRKIFSE